MFARIGSRLLLPCLIALPASAADFYVDVVNGNDINAGTSPASAWKTITHAGQLAPAGSGTTIHVAPGLYSPGTGEMLPLQFAHQVLIADGGPDVTMIDGQSQAQIIAMNAVSLGLVFDLTRLEGFTLQNAGAAISISQSQGAITTAIVNCGFANVGEAVHHSSGDIFGPLTLLLQDVTIDGANRGLNSFAGGAVHATLTGCTIRNCTSSGLTFYPQAGMDLSLTRTRIENDGNGIELFPLVGGATATLEDNLIAHNVNGLHGGTNVSATLRRCTVADNSGVGAQVVNASLESSVLHGNGTDLLATTIVANTFTQIGGPDPLFVDRVNGDYRLRFGSPCIDAGDPLTAVGTFDLSSVARPIDGNLDANERADIGALEFQPLRLVTSGHIGTPLRLEMSGQAGGTTTVYFSRSMPVSPMSTPFGQFDLNPASYGTLLHSAVAPFPPVAFQRPIPNNALLVGHAFSFQALTTSSIAPQSSAYTNVVSFIVLP